MIMNYIGRTMLEKNKDRLIWRNYCICNSYRNKYTGILRAIQRLGTNIIEFFSLHSNPAMGICIVFLHEKIKCLNYLRSNSEQRAAQSTCPRPSVDRLFDLASLEIVIREIGRLWAKNGVAVAVVVVTQFAIYLSQCYYHNDNNHHRMERSWFSGICIMHSGFCPSLLLFAIAVCQLLFFSFKFCCSFFVSLTLSAIRINVH